MAEPANENILSGQDPREAERIKQLQAKASYDNWVKWCEKQDIKLETQLENITPQMLIRAAARVVENKRKEWRNELDARNKAIKFAIENKQVLGDHYWQAEFKAYELYLAAQKIYETIKEEQINANS